MRELQRGHFQRRAWFERLLLLSQRKGGGYRGRGELHDVPRRHIERTSERNGHLGCVRELRRWQSQRGARGCHVRVVPERHRGTYHRRHELHDGCHQQRDVYHEQCDGHHELHDEYHAQHDGYRELRVDEHHGRGSARPLPRRQRAAPEAGAGAAATAPTATACGLVTSGRL